MELPQTTRRRGASRFANRNGDLPVGDGVAAGIHLGADNAGVPEHRGPKTVVERGLFDGHDGVQRVMNELIEFERRLQDEAKRQRIAIESSSIMTQEDTLAETAFKPGIALGEERTRLGLLGLEAAPMDKKVAEYAAKDIEMSELDLDDGASSPGRGAGRPPALNSGLLPLPWRGRLGYVTSPFPFTNWRPR